LPWDGVSGWDLSAGPLNIHFNNKSAFIWGIQFKIGYYKDTLYDG